MNNEKITSVLKELHIMSRFRVSLHNTKFEEIASYPTKKNSFCACLQNSSEKELSLCLKCEKEAFEKALKSKEPIIYKCRYNLVEAISPLYNFGILTGFLMMGQVRIEGEDIFPILTALEKVNKHGVEAKKLSDTIPTVKEHIIKSYVNIMTICASYLTLSNAITAAKPTVGQLTLKYISENFTDRITVKDICSSIGYSKSSVVSSFKKEYSTTVNTYLTNIRLERAKKMLENENSTINEVALSCGFSDQSYFSKVFSAKYNITPTEYRKIKEK